ncbi:hypothetical protein D9M71_750580 [compost metagenome]
MRGQDDFDFALEQLLFEQLVFADVGRHHFADLAVGQQYAEAETVDAAVVGDHGEVACALALDLGDQVFRDAAQAEAASDHGHAVFKTCQRLLVGTHALVETCHMHLFYSLWAAG